MNISDARKKIPDKIYELLEQQGIKEFRPAQVKAIKAGVFEKKNILVCTPTASGKTKVAEFAFLKAFFDGSKSVYVVPLKALANEKYKDFKRLYPFMKIALSIGNLDSGDPYLVKYDLIITTSEKLDSLIRHHAPWLPSVKCVIIDEIHLLNDAERGPTLEVLITLLKKILKELQVIGLSATIGNPEELAEWLGAELVIDNWRPVELKKAVLHENKLYYIK